MHQNQKMTSDNGNNQKKRQRLAGPYQKEELCRPQVKNFSFQRSGPIMGRCSWRENKKGFPRYPNNPWRGNQWLYKWSIDISHYPIFQSDGNFTSLFISSRFLDCLCPASRQVFRWKCLWSWTYIIFSADKSLPAATASSDCCHCLMSSFRFDASSEINIFNKKVDP